MKSSSLILCVTLITLILLGCSKEPESPTQPQNNFNIVGTWFMTKMTVITGQDTAVITPDQIAITRNYKSDHTFEDIIVFQNSTITETGTWSISGNTLTVTDPDQTTIYQITGNENNAILTETWEGGKVIQEWIGQ